MKTHKRVLAIKVTSMIVLGLFISRFFQWGYLERDNLSKDAGGQRIVSMTVSNDRGNILDRNGIPFTGQAAGGRIIIVPSDLRSKATGDKLEKLAACLSVDVKALIQKITQLTSPFSYTVDMDNAKQIEKMDLPGINIMYIKKRYDASPIAEHVLGYLDGNEEAGQAGMESFFNQYLISGKREIITYTQDANSKPIKGLGYKTRSVGDAALSIKTTLDYNVQKIVEDVLEKYAKSVKNFRAGVVVTNVNDGSMVSMASRPLFDRGRIADYLNDPQRALINRATSAYNLGSVFKIVDSFALLDRYGSGAFFRQADCTGGLEVAGRYIACDDKHGTVGLRDAFTYSCNSYFIEQGLGIGTNYIINAAKRMRLGIKTGIDEDGVSESSGHIPQQGDIFNDGDLANLCLGQGSITATPVQVAQMIGAVANGGKMINAWVADHVEDENGKTVTEFPKGVQSQIMSPKVSEQLRALMQSVVERGTGKSAFPKCGIGAGGKTGTAENSSGQDHAWFAGYAPLKQPKYAIVVLVENGSFGSKASAPIFREIVDQLNKYGLI